MGGNQESVMKAKTYYLHAKDMHRTLNDAHDGCVKRLVINPSDMDKIIEQAAAALWQDMREEMRGQGLDFTFWDAIPKIDKDRYRQMARAAYRAGGFVK
jgi:hypothetical protein